MALSRPNILYPATVTDASARYLATGRLDDMPCAVEVAKGGDEAEMAEIMLDSTSLRPSAMVAAELGRHLSAAAAAAGRGERNDQR